MKIGAISDSHDRLSMLDHAVKRLNADAVDLVLHAGDYISPFVVPHFAALKANLIGVYGNNDGDREVLRHRFRELGDDIRGQFAEVIADGLRIALLHGDEEELLRSLIGLEAYDVIVHGHTHKSKVSRKGVTLIVNPGEVCGYLSGNPSMAIIDTKPIRAQIIPL